MNRMLRGLCALGAGTALTLGAAQAKATVLVTVDPDGPGPQGAISASSLDWNVGNALAVNGVTATSNFVGGSGSTAVTVYAQSTLSAINTPTGTVSPSGVEWTVVAGIPETVTGVGSVGGHQVASFGFDPTGVTGDNFIKIYADTAQNANNLAGTGFNDGTLILTARITDVNSGFSASGLAARLDQFLTDNYPGVSTVSGVGATDLTAEVVSFDPAYFQLAGDGTINLTLFNASQVLPFSQVDPSARFVDDAGNTITPNIGAVNGVSGPDIQFQADANQSFDTVVIPEPMTGMLSLGMAGLLVGALRRRRTA